MDVRTFASLPYIYKIIPHIAIKSEAKIISIKCITSNSYAKQSIYLFSGARLQIHTWLAYSVYTNIAILVARKNFDLSIKWYLPCKKKIISYARSNFLQTIKIDIYYYKRYASQVLGSWPHENKYILCLAYEMDDICYRKEQMERLRLRPF